MKNKQDTTANKRTSAQQEIAIVGISLRFPGASSKAQFWHNLANKVSSISEIPAARFRWQDDFDPAPKKDEQKIVSKWGGFIDNIDGFDAGFFAISPKEAQSMDPQQRLSMELAWQCFEDAGLSPSTFKNTKTGVYLGCSNTDYQELATGNIDPHFLTGMSTGVFANRISHYFNFQGPSETVDTACSSSLVALHKAMNDFNAGEINAALVGGVNLLITKSRYVSFSKLGVLSPNGRCKTLDANADGYVRGEGVGMVLLMPLERALKENLTVYGVVKGSSVGHSGHTNTLTSPSPFSQSRVIQEAIDNAGIHSDDLSYIELHGTGTRLGDPIEIQGLKRAFRSTKSKKSDGDSTCYLSTVKTNIGHLESAAGIAGIIKVLLSFKHQQVPPLQNFETLNPKITLDKSPFALATDCVPLEQNHVLAGISSFGFAGVNAHVILQSPPAKIANTVSLDTPAVIVLSAKKPEALRARAKALTAFIEAQNLTDDSLADLAFTLQVGREDMSQRLAFSASAMAEVTKQLNLFIEGKSGAWQQGKADKDNASTCITADNQNASDALSQWLSGVTVDWSALYPDAKPQRLALPGYPFNPKPYWITSKKDAPKAEVLHPLLHKALPAFDELLFSSTFTGDEFFLADHQVNGERMLPGVCTLEMVRAAIALSHNLDASHAIQIKNVKWLCPISIEQGTSTEQNTVYLSLWQSDSAMQFEVWQKHEGAQQVCASGEVQVSQQSAPVTLFELTTESDQLLSPSDAYATFKNIGIDYGPRFQGLQQLSKQGTTATAKVAVPSSCCQGFGLTPALVDAALQSLIIFADQSHAALPFATEQVCFYNAQQLSAAQHNEVWVKATQTSNNTDNTQKFDLDICDLDGNLLMGIKGFSTRKVSLDAVKPSTQDLLTLTPCWQAVKPDFATSPELHAAYVGPQALKPDWLTESTDNNQLVWLAKDEYAQPLALFQQLKRMLADGFVSKPLSITLVTKQTQAVFGQNEQVNCEGAGLIGLLQSVAQEYPSWTVRIIDAEQLDSIPSEFTALPAGLYAHRTGQYFSFELAQHTFLDAVANNASLQKQGTYLVLGGAGGLGQVWSEWMIKHLDAQIIWLGRRELNADIQSDIDRLAKLGKAPLYIQCDASDKDAMESASKDIARQFGSLNGVVHSILHLEDQTLANMDEAQFNRSYHAKQQTGEVALEVFSQADLDFFLFFSSMQSFSPAAGQSNYAAGCMYLDSLARTYQHKCPVKIINWGYWGSVGVVQDEYYQKKMQAMSIGSIEAEQGMQALATLMGSNLTQAGVLKITQAALSDTFKLQSYSAQGAQHTIAKQSYQHQAPKQDSKAQVDLNQLCAALYQAGWQQPAQREHALTTLPEYFSKWWTETERHLEAHQLMKNGVIQDVEAAHNSNSSENLQDNCLANLPAILNGEIKATDALFPNASMALVEAVYQNNPVADYANSVLIEQLRTYLATANLESIRVLEIGAGTGGTTRSVLPALKPWQVEEYAYTDLSKAFFNHAKAQYQTDYPFVDTKYLDISKPLAGQNIDIGSYDVVIATNVLHATADIKNTLQNAKACLKQGGVLLINEVVHTSLFTHLTFGLLEGWWLSQDQHLRLAGSPMLSIENWQQALIETGFVNAFAAGDTNAPQQVFCAQSDGFSLQAKTPTHTKKKDNHKATQSMSSTSIQQPQHNADPSALTEFVHNALFDIASAALDMAPNELDADESFADYGVDSILAIQMLDEINAKFNVNLAATLLFDYPSIDTLSAYIIAEHKEQVLAIMPSQINSNASEHAVKTNTNSDSTHNLRKHSSHTKAVQAEQENLTTQATAHSGKIAIVGMSGQFGDADNLEEFWSMLAEKRTSVKAQTRWDLSCLTENQQSWSKYASLLNDISLFDAPFFSITPQEAMYMDPQQRLFLQEAYKALEDANMITKVAGQNVGVYLGCAQSDYAGLAEEDAPAQVFWGTAGSVIPARVSYFLNLKGPALAIDTACSSSLVALHSACQALNNNEISSALVGGVATLCTPKFSIHAGKAGMLSPDGTCYTFDDRANGFVPGEGAGVLVLKKLEDAERDDDHIYGVILGSATNQDGTTSGITAPSSLSQEQLHRDIYTRFDIAPDSIQMIEAHGTGTKLGDPIEFQALTRAFRAHTDSNEFCALGSVKTNIGHCLTAAGVAGVIKALLAMKHRTIPASLHYEQGNSHINWHNTPFFVNQEAIAWQSDNGQKRRAAVSSFGFSGTNAHVVLEEYQPQSIKQQNTVSHPVIITLSAKSKESLNDKAHALKSWLTRKNIQDSALTSLAFTLQSAREEMGYRMAFTASTIADVQDGLTQFINKARGHYKQGEVKQGKEILSALDSSDFMRWIEQGDLNKLLALWVVGADIDWPLLYAQQTPALLRLPTYPFAKTSFWLPEKSTHKPAEKCEPSSALNFNSPSANEQNTQTFEPVPHTPTAQSSTAPSALLHYTANWADKPLTSTEPATYHRQVVLLGDDLPEIYSVSSTRLSCTATETQAQLEVYTNGLIDYFKQLELQQGTITKKTPSKLLVQVVVKDQTTLLSALNGVLKTAAIEYSNIETQLIAVDDTNNFEHLVENEAKKQDACIRYQQGQRQVLTFDLQAYQQVDTTTLPWKEDGVYVITGGLGQLGQTFAKEIIQHTQQAHIVFVGRRAHNNEIQTHLDALGDEPSRLSYVSLNIANHDDVNALFTSLKAKHGGITGIIHSAGVIKDQLISNKTPQEVAQVFAPKVAGLIALDEASKTCDLDFFVCFSSIAGVFGNMGQADYACVNAFMDRFMAARQTQVSQGMRSGLSLSINWPLWSEGGMQVDSLTTSILQSQGIEVMPNEVGIDAFYRIFTLHTPPTQHCFLYGDASKLTQLWHKPSTTTQRINTGSVEGGKSHAQIRDHVKSIITDITKIDVQDLDDEVDFKDMGFDSIMLMSVVQQLESDTFLNIEALPPALLFEISTINELCDYLAAHQLPTQVDEPLVKSTPDSANLHRPMPLSKAQQGLWLLHKQNPQLSTYHVPMVFEVNDLNVDCMQAALNWLSQKHPILSVQLAEVEGLPQQQITGLTPTLEQNHTPVASKSALIDLIQADIKQPFALKQSHSAHSPLLWRATHWQINGQLDVVALVFHHLIIDGVSATLLLEQLWQTYHNLVANEPLEQAQPDTGFFTYLEWEKKMLNSEQSTQLKHYWLTQLQGIESELTLVGKQEKQSANKQAKRLELAINNNQVQRIHQFCSSNKINPAAFFLSAFQTLLSAKTQRDDITLGVPVLHRPTNEMANSLGLFVNQLPLSASVIQTHSFSQLASQNQHQLSELIKHSGYPFAEIVRAMGAKRAMHSHPIFQIGFAYHNFLKQDWVESNQDLMNAIWPECLQEPELDLSLDVTPLSNTFKIAFKFDEAVYPSAVIDALAKDYATLIDDVMFAAKQALGSLPIFANLQTKPGAQQTLIDLFEAQATTHPEHIAIGFGMQSINYRQLNDKANQFAHTLLNHPEFKLGTENLIALCAKPSIELIVAILGILKSGAAYVPLDPNSPAARIQHILADAKPSILVLGEEMPHAEANQHHQVINLQAALATTVQVANINRSSASNLAYIIYTSGSTGKPKGVLVEHRNVCSLFNNTQSLFEFNEQDTWCLFHSYAFDFSVWEIWGALLHGGKLLIPDELTRKESVRFAKFVIDNQVTILNQTPSAFYPLMDNLLASPHNALRKVIFGGEALDVSKLAPWFEQTQPHAELVNMYGITETTVHVTEVTIDASMVYGAQAHSIIGRALPGYDVLLLDEQFNPVQVGQVGEIFVAGCGVTRGYHNQPALTDTRFITHSTGKRLYRSGDLARFNESGLLEYMGRADDQVQIRGHRIEFGEVQHALQSLIYITDAYVTSAQKQRGQVLVAYIIAPDAPSTAKIRSDLLSKLPEYMIPAYFVLVPHFPITSNGKIDKQTLSKQLPFVPSQTAMLEAKPNARISTATLKLNEQSELKATVAQIWQQVLEVDHVASNVPFFEAGGDSLLANVLTAKFKSQLDVEFPLTQIFQSSTIEAMTDFIARAQSTHTQAPAQVITSDAANSDSHNQDNRTQDIALIGLSCQYPDSQNHTEFWHNLVNEKDLLKRLSESTEQGDITWLDSWVEGQDQFDPEFFNISEKNAKTMSYSQRQLLLHAWKAIEDAGYCVENMPNTGVYVSSSGADNPDLNLQDKFKDGQFILNAQDYVASTINQPGTLPTTISYHLGFTGPSLFVHSNCSSSMSAISLACSALKAGEIDYAIVGAACLYPQRFTGYEYEKGLNFAGDARCKVFDEQADGMIGGSGVSVIVLKRADDAVNDADNIYSLIRGIKVNNDGKDKAGFFAPGTKGQMHVIEETLKASDISPASISYVEAHGTGTALGDPIEFSSLQQVYQQYSGDKQFCGLGAVKSNLGHTDTLAGLTGLIKTSLALYHKKLPASLHFNNANPHIDLANSPFYVVDSTRDWHTPLLPRRAAVSSFGIGGTNAHAVLEEANDIEHHELENQLINTPAIIVLSAHTHTVLDKQVAQLHDYLSANNLTEQDLRRLAYTLQIGRTVMPIRTGFVVSSIAELKTKLAEYVPTATTKPTHSIDLERAIKLLDHQEILAHWVETGFTNWEFIYQGVKLPKLSLPTYPFALKAIPLGNQQPVKTPNTSREVNSETTLKIPVWIKKSLAKHQQTSQCDKTENHLILCDFTTAVFNNKQPKNTVHLLQSPHFAIEQKVSDLGFKLVQLIQKIVANKKPVKLQLVINDNSSTDTLDNFYTCFHALLKTASIEHSALETQILILNESTIQNDLDTILHTELDDFRDPFVRYKHDQREVLSYQKVAKSRTSMPFKAQGVYLITGGFGGIGKHFINELSKHNFNKTIIVVGRKAEDHPEVKKQLNELKTSSIQLHYQSIDVSNKMDVLLLVRDIVAKHGALSGVLHTAGLVKDTLLNKKEALAFNQVLAPKVNGVVALDEATQNIKLDFFVCFAGLSGVNGAATQCDYATANAFLDSYMHYRHTLSQHGKRHGISASIDWPYWQDGGMKINPDFVEIMNLNGLYPMPTSAGISAFYHALEKPQTLVEFVQNADSDKHNQSRTQTTALFESIEIMQATLKANLVAMAAKILGIQPDTLDADTDLGDLGADSIAFITFINQVNAKFDLKLSPSILFMHSTINSILAHIIEEHSEVLLNNKPIGPDKAEVENTIKRAAKKDELIAVIGMSGQFPQADNLDIFWQNLVESKDCVNNFDWTHIDSELSTSQQLPNDINWLGRLERNQDFDPLFFNIAPAESDRITLQESLLMTHVWQCIEDAGYDPKSLGGSNTGLFIGCQAGYYEGLITSSAYAPNRMSYFLDLHGPSEGVDTTCSSSLVAIHKAVQAIQNGECDQAIVGGVNIIDSPSASIAMHDIGALSPTGRCRTFSANADGIVRGEGVGMIFIKKLSKSEQDKDHIYATILGSAINHGGKSQGFTVPNAKAQTRLLDKAWQNAGIEPSSLSYIECHGTGTSLGDPVELDALKAAYKNLNTPSESALSCSLGSVKSNIGHLEIAAGIAGVIKVLLQLKHQTLVPSLHVDELNPYLGLENSPFKVQTEMSPWQSEQPRRAGVSSFGISGVNAHIVLEEYCKKPTTETKKPDAESAIVLSATSQLALEQKIKALNTYLMQQPNVPYESLIYTLQIGRTAHKYRTGWTASSVADLKQKISTELESNTLKIKKVPSTKVEAIADDDVLKLVNNPAALMRFWLEGHPINWSALYKNPVQKVSLPSTPFLISKKSTAPWLLLENQWQAVSLSCPIDWQAQLRLLLGSKKGLVVAKDMQSVEPLYTMLSDCDVKIVNFAELEQLIFTQDTLPSFVYFIADHTEKKSEQIKPLYEFIQAISKFDKHTMQLFYALPYSDENTSNEDISALLRSYTMRNPDHIWNLIEFADNCSEWANKLLQELVCPSLNNDATQPNHVKYQGQSRFGSILTKAALPANNSALRANTFKQQGVYLIAGALGELGMALCEQLLTQFNATLILLGRRKETQCSDSLEQLKASKQGQVHYLSTDIVCEQSLEEVHKYLDEQGLQLNGILHLGTDFKEDENSWADFEHAIQVKMQGSINLDKVFSQTDLDLFVMFSSMAVFGSLNHLSYSYGNGFQNAFARTRQQQVLKGERHGQTLAINWGYWHSNDPVKSIENSFAEKKGYQLITMPDAFDLMQSLLGSEATNIGALLSQTPDKIYQNTMHLMSRRTTPIQKATYSKNIPIEITTSSDIRGAVIKIVSNVIGISAEELDLDCDLYDYGFDSISLLKTFQQLKDQLNIELQADLFKNMNTISAFIDDIEKAYSQHSNSNNQSNLNITPDFILDAGFKTNEDTTTLKHVYESEISSILLTGATGFLGCHILQQLLDETDAIVFCIVRAHSLKQAKQRIQDTAQKYKLKLDLTRIEPMLGDMEKPQLGLSEKNWQHLCEQVQHIVHTASYVNHIQPYFAFKKSVAGTTQLLNIATSHTLKMMHFVSSTTASTQVQNSHFSVNPIEDFIDEEDAKLICSGYGQSKWVQEENIRQASELGVPYTIYRFAQISGSSKTGIGNTDDIFHRILKMMMSTSIQPKNMPYLLDIIPVDKAASSVAKGMNDKEKRNTVFHVSNSSPLPINEFYEFYEFVKKEQLTFQQSDKSAFIAACRDYIEQKTEGNTQVIMEGLLTQRPGYDEYLFETYLMPMSPYDKDNFNQLLSRYGIELTPWKTLYSTYFDYWKQDEHFKEIWPYKHEIESE
ncbi:non-ribosomal peptide synthetase [Pseudoalteromonas phenolica]|uniref:Amino acid adenylation domain/thioester reductase domain protein n=3 Tax=Pseudoalteromonas phenolica TaxID=161398 RepID=A0A0S2K881_9GAMM|nr:non-ribosomal peptide synthetase [Pseudoalteromonas phenolica]ALO44350.1 Amino acid adenylation domain/thioester reductase domain protein [Pseudoalteromonas phenolica]MBE0357360.1 rhizoxin biosynthesis, polyketide synthase RhiD [Pseudoalteromonas phenolica O-BC30]